MEEDPQPIVPSAQTPMTWAPSPKKRSNKLIIAIVVAVVAVMMIAAFAFTVMNTAAKVTSKANQMTIKLTDLPAGWHASETKVDTPEVNGVDWAYTVYNNTQGLDLIAPWCEIISQVFVFDTVSQAKADFNQLRDDPDHAMEEVPGRFEQCLVGETSAGGYAGMTIYAFQERNVCGLLAFTTIRDYDLTEAWLDEMLDLQLSKIV